MRFVAAAGERRCGAYGGRGKQRQVSQRWDARGRPVSLEVLSGAGVRAGDIVFIYI